MSQAITQRKIWLVLKSGLYSLGRTGTLLAAVMLLQGCDSLSYTQRESPNNLYKEYRPGNQDNAAVLGVGDPISARQMKADSTFSLQGSYDLEQVMLKASSTYNLAVRWGNGVRKVKRQQIVINQLTFDEARNYIEDTYDVQIIREGERRLLVLPSASEPRLATFSPGDDITLATAVKGLSEQCGYNLVINENKQELSNIRVTTRLKDVTCFDAFEALLNPHGLSLINTGDYYTISGLPQRQWTLNLYEPVRSEEQTVTLSTDSSGGGGGSSSSGGGGSSSQSGSGSNKITIKYDRDLWKDLETDLNQLIASNCPSATDKANDTPKAGAGANMMVSSTGLLPPPSIAGRPGDVTLISNSMMTPVAVNQSVPSQKTPSAGAANQSNACGYVRINQAVGVVQMRAPASVLEEANNLIQRVEDIASRRILLEARVLAVTRNRGYDQQGRVGFGDKDSGNGHSRGFNFAGSITDALQGELATGFGGVVDSTGASQSAGGFYFKKGNLDLAVSLLEKYGTAYTLMRPMMELMDRQRATLIDGTTQRYYVIQSQTTTSTATNTSNSVEERTQFIGLQFSASAQIGGEGEPHTISLQIPITGSEGTVNIPNPNDPSKSSGKAPIVTTRLIDQKVRVRDGEIKVVGGLTSTMAFDTESGVPVVRDIALLGKLANSENVLYSNVEFVVLIQVRRLI